MKLQKIFLIAVLLFCGISKAQVNKVSYEEAIDFLNCKTVELSLKEDKNLPDFKKKCPCNITPYKKINQFLSTVKLDATIALSDEIEELKKSYKENWKKEDVVTFLSESIFKYKEKYQKIFDFANKRKGKKEFDSYKASLKTDLAIKLIETFPKETVIQTNKNIQLQNLEDKISIIENNLKKNNFENGFFGRFADYLIILSIFLGVYALMRGLRKPNKENDYIELVRRLIKDQTMISHFQSQQSGIRYKSNDNASISDLQDAYKRINDLESEISKLKDKINSTPIPLSSFMQPTYQEEKQPEVRTETFFLSTPNSDGSFNESSALSIPNDAATIYKFIKVTNNRAKFLINEKETSVKLALQYPDKNIDPVCEALNAFNPKATKITTVEQGEAELNGSKWVVNKKAKINYEN